MVPSFQGRLTGYSEALLTIVETTRHHIPREVAFILVLTYLRPDLKIGHV